MVAVVVEMAIVQVPPIVVSLLVVVAAVLREEVVIVIVEALPHVAIVALALSEAIVAVVPIAVTVVVASKENVVEVVVDVVEEVSHSRSTLDLPATAFSCKFPASSSAFPNTDFITAKAMFLSRTRRCKLSKTNVSWRRQERSLSGFQDAQAMVLRVSRLCCVPTTCI